MFESGLFITIALLIITSAHFIFSLHTDNERYSRRAGYLFGVSVAFFLLLGALRFYHGDREGFIRGAFTLWGYFYLLGLLLLGILVYLYFSRWRKQWKTIAILTVPSVTLLLIASAAFIDSERRISMEFSHSLLPFHIIITILGELLFFLSFSGSVFYLVMEGQLKKKRSLKFVYRLPTLESIENFNRWAVSRGFLLLSAGLVTGVFMAVSAFQSPFMGTPKEIILYCSWVVLLLLFYLWYSGRLNSHRVSQFTIAAFAVLMGMAVFSNIYITSGFHSFK